MGDWSQFYHEFIVFLPQDPKEGAEWKTKYHEHCQLIYSSFQHHWHLKDDEGKRQPAPYCRHKNLKGKRQKQCKCRQGFPKKVNHHPRIVCAGIAKLLDLPITGRRDMTGAISPSRHDEYCSGTSAAIAALSESNSDVQCPYRVPLTTETHDPACTMTNCIAQGKLALKKLCKKVQRTQKNITGYFGGYISKAQPLGLYELKKSCATLPFLKKKLLEQRAKPVHQLAHTVNRMFTTLESKGIVRTTPQEFQLSADYNEKDNLSAEFIRTCKHADFHGAHLLDFADVALQGKSVEQKQILPRFGSAKPQVPWTWCYACRPKHPSCWYLSAYEFVQDFAVHRVRRPEKKYAGSLWTDVKPDEDEPLIPGKHYVLNERALTKKESILMFPKASVMWKDDIPDWYNTFRHSYVLVHRSVRVVPCVVGPVPNNRIKKERRAFILSVYLRPWTWSLKLADADVKHLSALDLAPTTVCNSWKTYLTHVFPHSFNTIRNFLGCCMAEGKKDAADDSDNERDDKAINYPWNLDHVVAALEHVRRHHHHHRHHCFFLKDDLHRIFTFLTCLDVAKFSNILQMMLPGF